MENERQQQIDVLVMASEYMDKLIPSMETIVSELKGNMQEDTVDFLMQITDGFNFMLEAYNVTGKLINEKEILVNEDVLEDTVGKLSKSFSKKDYKAVGEEFESSVLPFLKVYREAARQVINGQS